MVASSDTGIELNDTNAPRQSRNVSSSSTTTSTAPISSELRNFAIALSMKLAGRSSAGWYCTPRSASSGASVVEPLLQLARDVERVGAVLGRGLDQDAGATTDDGIAKARRRIVAGRWRCRRCAAAPFGVATTACASASAEAPGACACSTMRCVAVSR